MSLPNIAHIAGTWAEVVALAPVLNLFDNSEITIDNDIPLYDGSAGIIGTVLALFLVAVGSVKQIYQTNEDNEKRKRSIYHNFHVHIWDNSECAHLFLCSLAQQTRPSAANARILHLIRYVTVKSSLKSAIVYGIKTQSSVACHQHFKRCAFDFMHLKKLYETSKKIIKYHNL